ncbi:MAG: hypothetical protein SPH89_04705, partial [Candidatus Limisoma sp.]|nr:hypothetical protein [Candidatus Limisoma sp.]
MWKFTLLRTKVASLENNYYLCLRKTNDMERDAISKLYEWKARTNRKPLVIRGARQVGKTWLMKEF